MGGKKRETKRFSTLFSSVGNKYTERQSQPYLSVRIFSFTRRIGSPARDINFSPPREI